jgi:ribose transport system substrate-binding protein
MRVLVALATLAAAGGGTLAATASGQAKSEAKAAAAPYTVYLSNSYLGNDWRQQMEKTAEAAAKLAPLKGKVNLTVVNTNNDPTDQTNSLNQIILKKPNAIMIDASSPTALNATIDRACAMGIKVISFDNPVTATCATKVGTNFSVSGRIGAEWLAKTLHGKGQIAMDTGLAGAPVSLTIVNAFKSVLKKYPGIKVVATYQSQYALAPEQQAASSIVAAHPDLAGVLSQSYGSGFQVALKQAGKKPIPMYAQAYNGTFVQCATLKGAQCAITSNPATLGAEALRIALQELQGKKFPNTVYLPSPAYETNNVSVPGTKFQKIKVGVNAFPKISPGATIPFSPTWTHITAAQALGG